MKMSTAAITTANRETMPIFNSDQANERVRGIAHNPL
jgi:hypothetical protein